MFRISYPSLLFARVEKRTLMRKLTQLVAAISASSISVCSLALLLTADHVDDENFEVEFDFLGKDSIRYFNRVTVSQQVVTAEISNTRCTRI